MPEITPTSLDHVALWVADREPLTSLLCDVGMHVIEKTDRFTLVGGDAREGKLTLFTADGQREPGALDAVVLRVRSLPSSAAVADGEEVAWLGSFEGLRLGLVERPDIATEPDLDHVRLRVADVEATATALASLGFEREGDLLRIGDRRVELEGGGAAEGDRPLLNHLAMLVDSAEAVADEARERGVEVADFVDAPNTLAVFLWGPGGLKLEYVEHKPGFSLV